MVVGCMRRIWGGSCCVALCSVISCMILGASLCRVCISELCAVFAAQAMLLLLWVCCKRPRAAVTWVYVYICSVVLVRETILTMTGIVPCGVLMESNCEESRCAEYNHILWASSSCRRRECVRTSTQNEGWVKVHSVQADDIRTSWMVTAHLCVWAALALSIVQLWRWNTLATSRSALHSAGMSEDGEERVDVEQPISLILAVPVTYGLCAIIALRTLTIDRDDSWSAEAMIDAAELYSALALYAFQRLLVLYVDQGLIPGLQLGSVAAVVDVSAVEGEALELRRRLQSLVAAGIKQYIFLAFGCNAIEVSAKVWNWWLPSSCTPALARVAAMWFPHHNINITLEEEWGDDRHRTFGSAACADLWNVTSLLMVVADFFTCSIALFAIWTYERSFADFFHPMKPFWKFWGVKGLLSVGWLQASVLMMVGLWAEGGSWSDENFRTFLNYYLVCVEAFVLGCLNIFAYPPIPAPWAASSTRYPSGVVDDSLKDLDPPDGCVSSTALGRDYL
mmetsp:Transcript_73669/g.204846  ORF Transcript_73669/g.204846 Transcript_73669/m.204846 type:complete len:508 (-) Transcript_73669:124-1647(-)